MLFTHNIQNDFTGYLGNKMFQAAATIGIATRFQANYALPPHEYWQYFDGKIIVKDLSAILFENYTDPAFHYTPLPTSILQNKNINLNGYFQSIYYWNRIEKQIQETFEFNKQIADKIREKFIYPLHRNYEYSLVSIHVRRGDYLQHPTCHPALPMKYYATAASELQFWLQKGSFNTHIKYIIFSDDIAWCKENFEGYAIFKDNCIFVEGNTAAEDMFFMSQCQHHIIANSTFSWWGSYLSNNKNGKVIMAPQKNKWFGETYADKNVDDLYLSEWKEVKF